jgi:hypothetical protein
MSLVAAAGIYGGIFAVGLDAGREAGGILLLRASAASAAGLEMLDEGGISSESCSSSVEVGGGGLTALHAPLLEVAWWILRPLAPRQNLKQMGHFE